MAEVPHKKRVWLSWSSGKDCAYTLHTLRTQYVDTYDVVGLLTTFNETADRVAMHAVRGQLLRMQAAAAGLPVHEVCASSSSGLCCPWIRATYAFRGFQGLAVKLIVIIGMRERGGAAAAAAAALAAGMQALYHKADQRMCNSIHISAMPPVHNSAIFFQIHTICYATHH